MYCRTCGNKINDNAEICVKCGCKPLIGKDFCQNCGAKTLPQQQVCSKCNIKLKSTMTTTQIKKTVEKKGLKMVSTIFTVIAILLFLGAVVNMGVGMTGNNSYEAMERGIYAARCIKLGIIPLILGIICRKFAKRK